MRFRALLDLAQPEHVGQRPARRHEVRVRRRSKVPSPYRERLAGERDRLQVLLERGALTALPRRLREDYALAHDQIALGLLHIRIRPAGRWLRRREQAS